MGGWTCEVCTFLNDDALPSCEMCEASRPATPSSAAQQQPSLLPPRRVAQPVAQWPDDDGDDKAGREPFAVDDDDSGGHPLARDPDFWHCTLCTFLNSDGRSQCEMCQSARPGTSPASPPASASGGGAASAHGWPEDTDDIDEASDDHNVHDSAEVAAFRQRFNGWKARSEDSAKEWDLSLTDVFAFKSRHEVHLLLTETYHVDPATSPPSSSSSSSSSSAAAAAQPQREKKGKGKGKKGGGPLSLLSRGRGGKAKEDHGDDDDNDNDEGDDNDDTDNAPILGSADDHEVKKQSSNSSSSSSSKKDNTKDKSPSRGRGLLGLGGRGGRGGGDGAKLKKVERRIDLVLQMPARGNTDSVYFLERVKRDKDDLAPIRPDQELRASETGVRGIKVSDWINDVNEFLIEHSMQDEAPPLGYHHQHQGPLYLPTQAQALTLESILSRMMQLFDARKQKLKDEQAHFEKVMRDQELLKKFDDDYFGKREAYYHKASTVEPSGMKAHLEAYGITQEVKAMHGICGKKSLRLSKETGQVAIMVRLSDVMDDSLAASLGIEVLQPIILWLDFGRLPAAEKASDVQKHILAVKRGHKFPSPYLVVKQSQGEGDREGEEISNNRIASFYFKSIAMKYLRETWGANTRRKHFRHIRSWFSKNDDDVGSATKAKGDEEEEGDEEPDDDHEEEDMWVCGACTYLNVHGRQKCEICETPAQQHELGKDRLAEKKSRNTASASFMGQCSAKFLGGNFFVGLLAYLRKGMADHRLYCLICHRKHACASETPLVCCAERCVHYYEAMQMGQSFATTVVCPYTSCKAQDKIDREEAVAATFAMSDLAGQEMDRQAAELLLNMYRHQFLPNSDVKKFFFNGFKSWWGLGGTIKVTSVTNVMRPELVARFMRKRQSLSAKKIRVGYHGTSEEALPSILQKGLLVPGRGNDVGHKSDTGWWGGGIYLSPDPMVSSSYAWNSKLIVCAALLGRPYHCKQRMDGQACQKGYDSHISPWWSLSGNLGKEWVLFDEGQVMPCYVISFHKQ